MKTLIQKGRDAKKPLVVAGCVPQGSKYLKELDGISLIGVQQIDHLISKKRKINKNKIKKLNILCLLRLKGFYTGPIEYPQVLYR